MSTPPRHLVWHIWNRWSFGEPKWAIFLLVFFVCFCVFFSVWSTFPCYLLHFGTKPVICWIWTKFFICTVHRFFHGLIDFSVVFLWYSCFFIGFFEKCSCVAGKSSEWLNSGWWWVSRGYIEDYMIDCGNFYQPVIMNTAQSGFGNSWGFVMFFWVDVWRAAWTREDEVWDPIVFFLPGGRGRQTCAMNIWATIFFMRNSTLLDLFPTFLESKCWE